MDKGSRLIGRLAYQDFYDYLYRKAIQAKRDCGSQAKYARFINLVNIKKCFQPMVMEKKYQDCYFSLARADCPCSECHQNLLLVVVFKCPVPTEGDSGEAHCFHDSIYVDHEPLCN